MTTSDDDFTAAWGMARRGDPRTSFDAAASVFPKVNKLQLATYDFIEKAGPNGTTSWHVEEHFGNHGSTYRTRIAELCGVGAEGVRVWPPVVKKTGCFKMIKGTRREIVVATRYLKGTR